MIKANELRIGDWVLLPSGSYTRVESILTGGINLDSYDRFFWVFEEINPIPLTPDILEKAGLKIAQYSNPDDKEYTLPLLGAYSIEFSGDELYLVSHIGDQTELQHVKYLHQLQNLYFALTGEELDVKL